VEHVYFDYKYRLPLEDTAVLNLEFSRGTEAILTTGWFEAKEVMDRIALFGTAGSKSFEGFGSEMNMKRAMAEIARNLYKKLLRKRLRPYSLSQASLALYRELEHFVDCVIEDKEPLVTGKDGLECAKIVDKAYELWRFTNPTSLL
jgi:predicted dehydrogenase